MRQRAKNNPKIIFLNLPVGFIKNRLWKFSDKLTWLILFLKIRLWQFSVKRAKRYPESCFSYLPGVFSGTADRKFMIF